MRKICKYIMISACVTFFILCVGAGGAISADTVNIWFGAIIALFCLGMFVVTGSIALILETPKKKKSNKPVSTFDMKRIEKIIEKDFKEYERKKSS